MSAPRRGTPHLLGLPYDASASFLRGPAKAPPLIREALRSDVGNLWTEGMRDLGAAGALGDAGDLALPADGGARALIEAGVASLLRDGHRPIVLGGDHSVTYPVLRALAPLHAGLTIVHVDAHPDLYDDFERDRHSHACPFARIMEEGLAARLVQVGIRTMNGHQRTQADRFGVEVIDMRAWERGLRPGTDGPTYLSIDLDGLDPAHAPGVSHPEPGGLSTRAVIGLIQQLPGTLVGADVVEYNPDRDPSGVTARVAAKLVKEIADRMLCDISQSACAPPASRPERPMGYSGQPHADPSGPPPQSPGPCALSVTSPPSPRSSSSLPPAGRRTSRPSPRRG